jgi:hypothetical protein
LTGASANDPDPVVAIKISFASLSGQIFSAVLAVFSAILLLEIH